MLKLHLYDCLRWNNANSADKKVHFKNFASFIFCISEVNNAQIDNAKDIVAVMPVYNLIEYSIICLT